MHFPLPPKWLSKFGQSEPKLSNPDLAKGDQNSSRFRFLRWLSPLLIVSLGLHGVLFLVPIPPEAEEPLPEEPLPDPIQVTELPLLNRPEPEPEPEPEPAPPPPPPPEPEPIVTPPPAPPPAVIEQPILFEEPPPETETEPETENFVEPEDPNEGNEIEPEKPAKPDPEAFDATGTDPGDLSGYTRFSATLQDLDPTIVINKPIRNPFELEYLGERCFQDPDVLNGFIGVAIDASPQLQIADIITSPGFAVVNSALTDWFEQMKGGNSGFTAELRGVFDEPELYGWIYEQQNREWFKDGETYEAYYFPITVDLVNNTCPP